jgi:hypothetical protein
MPSSLVTFYWHSEGGYSASINRVEEFALNMATVVSSVMSINSYHVIRRQVPQDNSFYWIIWLNDNLLIRVEGKCWREKPEKFYSVAIMQDKIKYSRSRINLSKSKRLKMRQTFQECINEKIWSRLNLGINYYVHSRNVSSHFLHKHVNIQSTEL